MIFEDFLLPTGTFNFSNTDFDKLRHISSAMQGDRAIRLMLQHAKVTVECKNSKQNLVFNCSLLEFLASGNPFNIALLMKKLIQCKGMNPILTEYVCKPASNFVSQIMSQVSINTATQSTFTLAEAEQFRKDMDDLIQSQNINIQIQKGSIQSQTNHTISGSSFQVNYPMPADYQEKKFTKPTTNQNVKRVLKISGLEIKNDVDLLNAFKAKYNDPAEQDFVKEIEALADEAVAQEAERLKKTSRGQSANPSPTNPLPKPAASSLNSSKSRTQVNHYVEDDDDEDDDDQQSPKQMKQRVTTSYNLRNIPSVKKTTFESDSKSKFAKQRDCYTPEPSRSRLQSQREPSQKQPYSVRKSSNLNNSDHSEERETRYDRHRQSQTRKSAYGSQFSCAMRVSNYERPACGVTESMMNMNQSVPPNPNDNFNWELIEAKLKEDYETILKNTIAEDLKTSHYFRDVNQLLTQFEKKYTKSDCFGEFPLLEMLQNSQKLNSGTCAVNFFFANKRVVQYQLEMKRKSCFVEKDREVQLITQTTYKRMLGKRAEQVDLSDVIKDNEKQRLKRQKTSLNSLNQNNIGGGDPDDGEEDQQMLNVNANQSSFEQHRYPLSSRKKYHQKTLSQNVEQASQSQVKDKLDMIPSHFLFTRCWYVKERFEELLPSEYFQYPFMIQKANECFEYIQDNFESSWYNYTGSPFFNASVYRLMFTPHRFIHQPNRIKDYQYRDKHAFNPNVNFCSKVLNCQHSTPYLDQLMQLVNLLSDGLVYIERRSFCMLLCALFKAAPQAIVNPLFLNPMKFPLLHALDWLVFDELSRTYVFKRLGTIDYNKASFYELGSFGQQFSNNEKLFSDYLDDRNSIIVELIFHQRGRDIPQSIFGVIRKNADKSLTIKSSYSKKTVLIPKSIDSKNNELKEACQVFIHDFTEDPAFSTGMKQVFEVRFYGCKLRYEMEKTILYQYDDFQYRARQFFVRFFSMYSSTNLHQAYIDLHRGIGYLQNQVIRLTYEKASKCETWKEVPNDLVIYYKTPLSTYKNFDYIIEFVDRFANKSIQERSDMLRQMLGGQINNGVSAAQKGYPNRPLSIINSIYQFNTLVTLVKNPPRNSELRTTSRKDLLLAQDVLESLHETFMELIHKSYQEYFKIYESTYLQLKENEFHPLVMALNWSIPDDLKIVMGLIQSLADQAQRNPPWPDNYLSKQQRYGDEIFLALKDQVKRLPIKNLDGLSAREQALLENSPWLLHLEAFKNRFLHYSSKKNDTLQKVIVKPPSFYIRKINQLSNDHDNAVMFEGLTLNSMIQISDSDQDVEMEDEDLMQSYRLSQTPSRISNYGQPSQANPYQQSHSIRQSQAFDNVHEQHRQQYQDKMQIQQVLSSVNQFQHRNPTEIYGTTPIGTFPNYPNQQYFYEGVHQNYSQNYHQQRDQQQSRVSTNMNQMQQQLPSGYNLNRKEMFGSNINYGMNDFQGQKNYQQDEGFKQTQSRETIGNDMYKYYAEDVTRRQEQRQKQRQLLQHRNLPKLLDFPSQNQSKEVLSLNRGQANANASNSRMDSNQTGSNSRQRPSSVKQFDTDEDKTQVILVDDENQLDKGLGTQIQQIEPDQQHSINQGQPLGDGNVPQTNSQGCNDTWGRKHDGTIPGLYDDISDENTGLQNQNHGYGQQNAGLNHGMMTSKDQQQQIFNSMEKPEAGNSLFGNTSTNRGQNQFGVIPQQNSNQLPGSSHHETSTSDGTTSKGITPQRSDLLSRSALQPHLKKQQTSIMSIPRPKPNQTSQSQSHDETQQKQMSEVENASRDQAHIDQDVGDQAHIDQDVGDQANADQDVKDQAARDQAPIEQAVGNQGAEEADQELNNE